MIISTRKVLALALFFGVLGLGLLTLFCWPRRYESVLKILISPGTGSTNTVTSEIINSEIEILKSQGILSTVRQQLSESNDELKVEALTPSSVIRVSHQADSPEKAAKFLQTLYAVYTKERLHYRPQFKAETALRERSADFNQLLNEATDALKKLDTQHDLQSLPAQQDLVLKQFFELQKQAESSQIERRAITDQITRLQTQLDAQPDMVETGSTTKYGQAADKLKEELHALEMQHTQLLQKYQPGHRVLRDSEQRIAQARELIVREEQNPPRERSFARNETRGRISEELLEAQTRLAALSQREQRLSELTKSYQKRLAELNGKGFEKSDLERKRMLNEEAYLLFQKKAQEAEINALLEVTMGVQIRLLEPASLNHRPISPTWSRSLVGLALLGFMTSIGGVIVAESRHPRLRHRIGLQRRFGLKILAQLPPGRQQ